MPMSIHILLNPYIHHIAMFHFCIGRPAGKFISSHCKNSLYHRVYQAIRKFEVREQSEIAPLH